jgi:hypothetical protein
MIGSGKIRWSVLLAIAFMAAANTPVAAQKERSIPTDGFESAGGFVNFVEGSGRCICAKPPNAKAKQALTSGDTIELDDGRAEIVLIPGFYVRFSNHTTVRFLDLADDNLKVEILSGSAIVEIVTEPEWPFASDRLQEIQDLLSDFMTIITPGGEFAVTKGGGYRFDVASNGASNARVLKGALAISGHILKDGNVASATAGAVEVHSAEKSVEDAFDIWSRNRAAALIASNKSLKQADWYKKMQHGGYLDIPRDKTANDVISAHVVSARSSIAGFVENGVSISGSDGAWRELKSGEELSDGDRVRTAAHARAEIRPYFDFDLFVGGNTEISYAAPVDGNISVTVIRGSAVLLIQQPNVKRVERNTITLSSGYSSYVITSTGYYRLNVFADGTSEMLVYAGSVVGPGGPIGSTKRIVVHGQSRTTSPLDKDSRDSFDFWSTLRDARNHRGRPRGNWSGLWFLNPTTSEYTFVPALQPWKSPYGGSYSTVYLINLGRLGFRLPRFPGR